MINARTLIFAGVCAALLLGVVLLARRQRAALETALPPRIVCADQLDAQTQAGAGAVSVLGTGSMAPYIPPARAGLDPLSTVVAYVALVPGAHVRDVKAGDLCIYVPTWAGRSVMHQAAEYDGGGWIMTGLHNRGFENRERMTGEKFVGIIARAYVWAQ